MQNRRIIVAGRITSLVCREGGLLVLCMAAALGASGVALLGCDGSGSPEPNVPATVEATDLAWDLSPDDASVIYEHRSVNGEPGGLYSIGTDGHSPGRAFLDDAELSGASEVRYSPMGDRAAFVLGGHDDIYIITFADSVHTRLTFTNGNARSPDWDPSGRYIIYERPFRYASDPETTSGLFIVDTDTGVSRPLAHQGTGILGGTPRWSPDSTTIAFCYGSPLHVFAATVDGVKVVDLTPSDQRSNVRPMWTKDGTEIIYESFDADYRQHETRVVSRTGGRWRRWPISLSPFGYRSALSRSGRVFVSTSADRAGRYGVLYMQQPTDTEGGTRKQLTSYEGGTTQASERRVMDDRAVESTSSHTGGAGNRSRIR